MYEDELAAYDVGWNIKCESPYHERDLFGHDGSAAAYLQINPCGHSSWVCWGRRMEQMTLEQLVCAKCMLKFPPTHPLLQFKAIDRVMEDRTNG